MSKKQNIIILAVAALMAALLTSACTDDHNDASAEAQDIRFSASVWQVMEGTRATTFDNTAAIQTEGSFTCTAYDAGTTTVNTTSNVNNSLVDWNTTTSRWAFRDGIHKWPTSGSLDFFAYMPATKPAYISAITYAVSGSPAEPRPYFTCDMTQTVEKEFIYALSPDQDKTGTNSTTQPYPGQVQMTFCHPFARIYFQLSSASGSAVTINSITISGTDFYKTGTCTFDGTYSTWSNKGNTGSMEALAIGTPYIVIPNDYGSSKTITVDATWNEWGTFTTTVTSSPLTINWQAGYSYTYTFTLSKYALKVDVVDKYTEQW